MVGHGGEGGSGPRQSWCLGTREGAEPSRWQVAILFAEPGGLLPPGRSADVAASAFHTKRPFHLLHPPVALSPLPPGLFYLLLLDLPACCFLAPLCPGGCLHPVLSPPGGPGPVWGEDSVGDHSLGASPPQLRRQSVESWGAAPTPPTSAPAAWPLAPPWGSIWSPSRTAPTHRLLHPPHPLGASPTFHS